MGDHHLGPAAAGALAEARLQAGFEVAERDALAAVHVAGTAAGAERLDAPDLAVQHGHEHGPRAVVEVADDLVARHEREADDRLEVARRAPVDRGQVGAADAGQAGPEGDPAIRGQAGLVQVPQAEGRRARRRRGGAHRRSPPRRSEPACGRTRAPSPAPPDGRRHATPDRWAGAGGCRPRPCRSARPATPACGPARRGGSRGSRPRGIRPPRAAEGHTSNRRRRPTRPDRGRGRSRSRTAPGPAIRRWGARRRARRCRSRRGAGISAQMTSSNSGMIGSMTTSSAPVISSVRCPSARCSRTRRMAAGNDWSSSRWLNMSTASSSQLLDRRALVAPVEQAQEVAAVPAVGRQQRRRLGERAERRTGPGRRWAATGGEPRVRRHHVLAMSVFSRSKAAKCRSGESTWRRSRIAATRRSALPGRRLHPGVGDHRGQVDLADVAVPVDDPGVEPEGLSARPRPCGPRATAGCRPRRRPRTRRTRRRARRR